MTRQETIDCLENISKDVFEKFEDLNILAVIKGEKDDFYIDTDLKNKTDLSSFCQHLHHIQQNNLTPNKIFISQEYGESNSFQLEEGQSFKGINNNGNNITLSLRNKVRNLYTENTGIVNLIFNINNKVYLLTNEHVIGREQMEKGDEKDSIQIYNKITEEYEVIGQYTNGIINDYCDFAIAEFTNNPIITSSDLQNLEINRNKIDALQKVAIHRYKDINIISNYAHIRVKDGNFYEENRIMKNQLLIDKKFVGGNSGSVAFFENKPVGLLFASSNNYSALNKMDVVFNKLEELDAAFNKKNIRIYNQF